MIAFNPGLMINSSPAVANDTFMKVGWCFAKVSFIFQLANPVGLCPHTWLRRDVVSVLPVERGDRLD
jgi:hypothetical protein